MRFVLCLTALLGCGDNLGDPGLGYSGSRLRIERYVLSDGTRLPLTGSFHDAARGERCTPRTWSDGSRYCTPATDDVVYLDAGCTMAIGRSVAGATPAYFARYFQISGTAWVSRLYPAEAKLDGVPGYWLGGTSCDGPFPGDSSFEYYALGRELVNTDFARIKHSQPSGAERLAVIRATSDDGLRLPIAIHDTVLDTDCVLPAHHESDSVACTPAGAVAASYFHDAQCSELVVSSTVKPAVVAVTRESCTSYFEVGAEVTGEPLYDATGVSCGQAMPSSSERQYLTGAPIEPPSLVREREPGARFSRIVLAAGETRMLDDLLFDSELGADCRIVDGMCVPETSSKVRPAFRDELCAVPIDIALVPSGACDPSSPYARSDAGEIQAVRSPFQGTIYELSTGDRCVPFIPAPGFTAYEVDAPLPPSTFATAMVVAD